MTPMCWEERGRVRRPAPRLDPRFVEGSAKALDYTRENPEETKAIFARVLAERGETADVDQCFAGYGVRERGLPVERDIQFWIDVLERQGSVEKGKLVAKDILYVTGDSPATNGRREG